MENDTNATVKIMTIKRGTSPIYVAIQGLAEANLFTLNFEGDFLAGNPTTVGLPTPNNKKKKKRKKERKKERKAGG
ncbi:MAG UNVERIFIED_CONTAM: hypothetical protein LVR18_42565 [Planctomycetaceae bacterium]